MKYLYLFFIYLLVNSDCPNLCSGHGTCSPNGKCVCNTQPGLGLNKGAFDEFSWTGADCSLRTCPKGQSFSYDIFRIAPDTAADINDIKFVKQFITGNTRMLFESDNGRQAAAENEEETETPAGGGGGDPVNTATEKPTPTTQPTTPRATTTAPEIITKPPIIVTPPPIVTIPEEEKKSPVNNNSFVVSNITDIDRNDIVSSEVIIFNEKTGEIIGKVTIKENETKTIEEVFNELGITDVSNIKIAEKPKTYAETTPTINFVEHTVTVKVTNSLGKEVDGKAVPASDGMKNKLNTLYKPRKERMLFDEMRVLADTIDCGGTNIPSGKDVRTKMWCVESENPKDSNYFKMRLVELNLKCYEKDKVQDPKECPSDNNYESCKETSKYDVFVSGPANELEDINSACFYLGDENARIEDSELFSKVGERGGDYYFAKFTEGSTVIVAPLISNDDGTVVVNYQKSASLVGKPAYDINRPIGDIQKSIIPGGKMIMTKYDPTTGKLGTEETVTIDKGGMSDDGKLIIETPKQPDMNATSPSENPTTAADTGTGEENEEDTPTPAGNGRELWEERELQTGSQDIVILQFVEYPPHSFIECSGQGNCDRTTGQCQCYAGFEGDACQRTSCPNACSNNGRCVVLNEALGYDLTNINPTQSSGNAPTNPTEFTQTVSEPFDSKIFGCICDEGHRGPDCSLYECPSTDDPSGATNSGNDGDEYRDCSGRGICDYESGTCTCFEGYYGTACENMASFI